MVRKNTSLLTSLLGLWAAGSLIIGANVYAQEADSETKKGAAVSLETEKAKLGYTVGAQIAGELLQGDMFNEIELDALLAAISDFGTGATPKMSIEDMQAAQQAFVLKRQQEFAALAAQNQAQGESFLAESKAKPGVTATESGLLYEVLREGKGKQATAEDKVRVHYLGMFPDGTAFDSSYQGNAPVDFPVTQVIPGFSEGLQLMKEGGKYRFVMPAELGYGELGQGNIGPNQVLVFEVELLSVL
ncbi:MAG: FKBP-type peptidyl-prolyl cis-trans isomerase [Pseudomonadota bacterium]